jgi:hypothetical protein
MALPASISATALTALTQPGGASGHLEKPDFLD